MKVSFFESESYFKIVLNEYKPVLSYNSKESEIPQSNFDSIYSGFEFNCTADGLVISMPLEVGSHVLGLGERAFGLERKRKRFSSVNTDPGGYQRGRDPIYLPLPFFVKVSGGAAQGIFINYPGEMVFDLGAENYDRINIKVLSDSVEMYVFKGVDIKDAVKAYIQLTGKTFLPPKWAIGHTVSRYTYYPEKNLLEVIDRYRNETFVDAVYLDIDYMDRYHLFTWNKKLFNGDFLDQVHKRNVKLVTIVNPSVKADQNFDLFRRGMGHYMEKSNGDLYTGPMWPGLSVFPDFINSKAREFWKAEIRTWAGSGVDGIWLDMNEPTLLTEDHLFDGNALHRLDNGETVAHSKVRNLYPYYQCQATYEALSEKTDLPFILTRSGYAGVQKYAAVWTGDNVATWDDLKLQITAVTGLSLSGVTVVGCDLGGFLDDSDPDLISAYYRLGLFFPLYRNHKDVKGRDQEVWALPSRARNNILSSIELRYKFIDHIYSLIEASHRDNAGPVVTPMPYEFPGDEDSYFAEDQYMVGEGLLYAPQISKDTSHRTVYLPEGNWYDFWTWDKIKGPSYVESSSSYPIYMKENSYVLYDGKIIVSGTGKFTLYVDGEKVMVESDGKNVSISGKTKHLTAELVS